VESVAAQCGRRPDRGDLRVLPPGSSHRPSAAGQAM